MKMLIIVTATLLVVSLGLASVEVKQKRVVVEGELQQHNPRDGKTTWWVNGLRLVPEDRPELAAWLEQHVGGNIRVIVEAR